MLLEKTFTKIARGKATNNPDVLDCEDISVNSFREIAIERDTHDCGLYVYVEICVYLYSSFFFFCIFPLFLFSVS